MIATIAPWLMLAAGIPLAGLTIYAFGWRKPCNDCRSDNPDGLNPAASQFDPFVHR